MAPRLVTTNEDGWAELKVAPKDRLLVELQLRDGQLQEANLSIDDQGSTTIRYLP